MPNEFDDNDFTLEELETLFEDDNQPETSPEGKPTDTQTSNDTNKDIVDTTKAFSKRLKESTDKARLEEREAIAKSMGYNSYEELKQANEERAIKEKELDPEQVLPIVNELVKKRMEDDPRLKELDELRKRSVKEYGERELAEITKLTDGKITKLSQLPKEVIDLWKKDGSLKSAYLTLEGEKLITELKSDYSKGSTNHLQNPSGNKNNTKTRLLTEQEKKIWKKFNPKMTDEELNKQTVEIN